MVVQTHNFNTGEVEGGGSRVRGHHGLLRENLTTTSSKRRKTGREMKKMSQIQSGHELGWRVKYGAWQA